MQKSYRYCQLFISYNDLHPAFLMLFVLTKFKPCPLFIELPSWKMENGTRRRTRRESENQKSHWKWNGTLRGYDPTFWLTMDGWWMVGGWALPLWKIWLCQLGWWNLSAWKSSQHVPNHQTDTYMTRLKSAHEAFFSITITWFFRSLCERGHDWKYGISGCFLYVA